MGKWIAFSVWDYVVGLLCSMYVTGTNLLLVENQTTPLGAMDKYQTALTSQDWGSMVNPLVYGSYFASILRILTLDLPLFGGPEDPAQIIRWIILFPITSCVVIGLVLAVMAIFSKILN